MESKKPILYLFPVPMGDTKPTDVLPARNIELLAGIRHFIVENVRSARRFLRSCLPDFDIDGSQFVVLDEHTSPTEVAAMLAPMAEGHSMGVISEAGCPAVADPGADAVAVAQQMGYEVCPLVGPSSIIMSLMGSGFNGQSFAFNGYLPIDAQQRTAKLKEMERRIRRERQTQIFIETPYRNDKMLQTLCQQLPPDMLLCAASDITGEQQKITTMPISRWKSAKATIGKVPTIFLLYS